MDDFLIIIPTHSGYENIVNNFLQLFKKNWNDCKIEIIISVTGENISFDGYTTIYNGTNASLIDCIVNVTRIKKSKYYICFLGDAFINKKVNNQFIIEQFKLIKNNKIDYCCLNYVKKYRQEKIFNDYFRFIHSNDRYSHSFVAFIASYKFINNELNRYDSDFSFEMKFLNEKKDFYYKTHLIVRKNILGILPSISKGKWDRINYRRLKRDNPEIKFDDRPVESIKITIINIIRNKLISLLPDKLRIFFKKISKTFLRIEFISKS